MLNPYKILGISNTATDDEVKKAYRSLSRKYHPDANINNSDKDKAEEMFKLVQQAYEQIMHERENPEQNQAAFGGYKNPGYGGYYRQYDFGGGASERFKAAYNYIQSGRYNEALNVLGTIEERNGWWYYLSAVANANSGNNIRARDHAKTAVLMEPDNMMYRSLLSQLERSETVYTARRVKYGYPAEMNMSCVRNMCSLICLSQICCGGGCPVILCC